MGGTCLRVLYHHVVLWIISFLKNWGLNKLDEEFERISPAGPTPLKEPLLLEIFKIKRKNLKSLSLLQGQSISDLVKIISRTWSICPLFSTQDWLIENAWHWQGIFTTFSKIYCTYSLLSTWPNFGHSLLDNIILSFLMIYIYLANLPSFLLFYISLHFNIPFNVIKVIGKLLTRGTYHLFNMNSDC